jgi:hypothetical protein
VEQEKRSMPQSSKLATIVMTADHVMIASLAAIFVMRRAAINANCGLVRYHL